MQSKHLTLCANSKVSENFSILLLLLLLLLSLLLFLMMMMMMYKFQ